MIHVAWRREGGGGEHVAVPPVSALYPFLPLTTCLVVAPFFSRPPHPFTWLPRYSELV